MSAVSEGPRGLAAVAEVVSGACPRFRVDGHLADWAYIREELAPRAVQLVALLLAPKGNCRLVPGRHSPPRSNSNHNSQTSARSPAETDGGCQVRTARSGMDMCVPLTISSALGKMSYGSLRIPHLGTDNGVVSLISRLCTPWYLSYR
jgi:hypothetical protein